MKEPAGDLSYFFGLKIAVIMIIIGLIISPFMIRADFVAFESSFSALKVSAANIYSTGLSEVKNVSVTTITQSGASLKKQLILISQSDVKEEVIVIDNAPSLEYSLGVVDRTDDIYTIRVDIKDKYLKRASINKNRTDVLRNFVAVTRLPEAELYKAKISVPLSNKCSDIVKADFENDLLNLPKLKILLC